MKKILTFVLFFMITCISVFAFDIIQTRPSLNQTTSFGLYQVGNDVTVYEKPDENSNILYRIRWNKEEFFPEDINYDKFFVVYISSKDLALVNVMDYEDEWLEIVYNNQTNKTGWIKMDDPYKFMTWVNFYNAYGKKYGLVQLKGAPDLVNDIKASPDEKSKTLAVINHAQKINLNVIKGNWALVSVMDLDKTPKTGYIRWRSDDGVRYYFPAMK